jgi:hypothetical protein
MAIKTFFNLMPLKNKRHISQSQRDIKSTNTRLKITFDYGWKNKAYS